MATKDAAPLEVDIRAMIQKMRDSDNNIQAKPDDETAIANQKLSPANPINLFNLKFLEMQKLFTQSDPDTPYGLKLCSVMETFTKPDFSAGLSLPDAWDTFLNEKQKQTLPAICIEEFAETNDANIAVGYFIILVDEGTIKLLPGSSLALAYNNLYNTVLMTSRVLHEAPNSTDDWENNPESGTSTQSDIPILETPSSVLRYEGYGNSNGRQPGHGSDSCRNLSNFFAGQYPN
jgi:hypothetical protein